MKTKNIKRICIGVILLAVMFCVYVLATRAEAHGRAAHLAEEEYQGYYIKAVWRRGWFTLGTGWSWTLDIYFLPGQKTRMINKIKEDIFNDLETLVEENGDIFYKYDLSNDFRGIRIYIASGDVDGDRLYDIRRDMGGKLGTLLELHYTISDGQLGGFSHTNGDGVFFIEPDD